MYRWLLLILLVMLAGLQYRLWFGEANLRQVWQLEQQILEQQQVNQQLTERNKRLEAEVQDLKQGLTALEERARSEMGMIREGETFFQLIEPEPETSQR
ncbi:cell division protein FtsB [Marinobacterium sediminicola]|uniref:Cell division protein FtsB n=1 Tax=Marinobacterium sediminicola TaxID=518898 RepID=A0ABY1S0D1_9GAMM|nr:cell division protein FtsB [Marinobacterium sediminicola]ULG69702.1 cell division protein FtsB [Marinobacterium sediminicola]SMR74570.1 cell division protein FtsB [Marinobacterium sediminicola]